VVTGDEQQIVEFLNHKRSKAGKWTAEGTLTIAPPSGDAPPRSLARSQ
jgi:hypothetical protein